MEHLPITHITLYKHGVGFFERRAELSGEEVKLSFRVEEMNDILKSLTVIDWGEGQVLGVDYATPQSIEERLAGCSVRLGDDRSLRDLLMGLRGRRIQLLLDQREVASGTLLGLDELPERQPLATSLVSVLLDETAQVQSVPLGRVQGVEILDERGASDLRFFLQTSLSQENYRQVMIRLTPGEHELSVSYIAPAPTWRVSYRLVLDSKGEKPRCLLFGWGIFDNRLEEDLKDISLSLVAGMPISFIYDLYTPFTPERPEVKEEARVAAAPVEFEEFEELEEIGDFGLGEAAPAAGKMMRSRAMAPPAAASQFARFAGRKASIADMKKAVPISTKGEALGELFQYVIGTPVTVGRGQSAMVPILSADLDYHKDLLYNGSKMPAHPVATLRLNNETELTLERGPVTVLENGEYVGEAVLPFTVVDGEVVVAYAVELGIKVKEDRGSKRELYGLRAKEAYLHVEEWDIRWCKYQLNNSARQEMKVLVEHPRSANYELIDTPDPKERTADHFRFEVNIPAGSEKTLRVQERCLMSRYEDLQKQSLKGLGKYLKKGLIDRATYDKISGMLKLWEQIAEKEKEFKKIEKERQKIYKAQQQIQGNMGALGTQGKEGILRARYVDQLEVSEEQLKKSEQQETDLKTELELLKAALEKRIEEIS